MKTKKIVVVSILLASCAAVAADSPFEKGKTYSLSVYDMGEGPISFTAEIKDVKDKWILINNKQYCSAVNSDECWVNTDSFRFASPAK